MGPVRREINPKTSARYSAGARSPGYLPNIHSIEYGQFQANSCSGALPLVIRHREDCPSPVSAPSVRLNCFHHQTSARKRLVDSLRAEEALLGSTRRPNSHKRNCSPRDKSQENSDPRFSVESKVERSPAHVFEQ